MNNHQKFLLCQQMAQVIVAGYRAEAPEGCDPQNSWVAAAVAVGTTVYTAVDANQKSKKAKAEQKKALEGANLGRIPDAALYEPVDFNEEQLKAILGNSNALDEIRWLMGGTNRLITNDALRRADALIPGYSGSMRSMGMAANDLINARLPADVVEKVVGDRAQVSSGVNIPGVAGPATLKDLNLTSLDAINMGTGLLGKMVSMAETVSPRGAYMTPQSMMLSPSERLKLAMEQNALIQQSEQNKNFIEAGADPRDAATLGLKLAGGGGSGGSGVNWGQTAGSMAQTLLGAYNQYQAAGGGSGINTANAGGGYVGSFYSNPNSQVTNQIYRATPAYSSTTGVYR